MTYGFDVTARNTAARLISSSAQVRRFIIQNMAQIKEQIAYYMENARQIREGLIAAGYQAFGGVNSPYVWLKTPDNLTSWEFFDYLLENAQIVGTPGAGFGENGKNYFRLTSFGKHEKTAEAMKRFDELF